MTLPPPGDLDRGLESLERERGRRDEGSPGPEGSQSPSVAGRRLASDGWGSMVATDDDKAGDEPDVDVESARGLPSFDGDSDIGLGVGGVVPVLEPLAVAVSVDGTGIDADLEPAESADMAEYEDRGNKDVRDCSSQVYVVSQKQGLWFTTTLTVEGEVGFPHRRATVLRRYICSVTKTRSFGLQQR